MSRRPVLHTLPETETFIQELIMLKVDDLFPEKPNESRTHKHSPKWQRLRRNLINLPRNLRRHRAQRSFENRRRNLERMNTPYPLPRCEGKFRFTRRRDATRSADSYMDEVCMTFDPMVPYYCSHHLKWHTGHDSRFPKERRPEYHAKCVERERIRKRIWKSNGP